MKIIPLAALVAAVASATANAQVTTIFSDSFNYPNGNLTTVSAGVWTAHSEAGITPVQVINGTTRLLQGAGAREDVSAALGDTLSIGEIFTATFDLIITGGNQNGYFASFKDDTPFAVAARLFVVPPVAGGDYSLGISNTGVAPDPGGTLVMPFLFGVTYRPSISVDADTGLATLMVDETAVSSTTATSFAISTFALHQRAGNSTEIIDNLVVTATLIPEPSAMLALISGGSLLGILRRRNRRN